MRNQRLRAKRMRNQGFRIYIQMSTVIHKFLLHIFFRFSIISQSLVKHFKKNKSNLFLIFFNLNQVPNYFWRVRYTEVQ